MSEKTLVQFNWRKHWKQKVVPLLKLQKVQEAIDLGMRCYDPDWKSGSPPYLEGYITLKNEKVIEGTLSWYQPAGLCHYIAPFAMVIGSLIFPNYYWKYQMSQRHSVAVGYDCEGDPRVVMDILNFKYFSAELSMEFADPTIPDDVFYARLRELAAQYRTDRSVLHSWKRVAEAK